MKEDPYEILGVVPGADEAEIRRNYLEQVRLNPPDRNPERFALVREAYELLRDPMVRLSRLLFQVEEHDTIEAIRADAVRALRDARIPTKNLLALADKK